MEKQRFYVGAGFSEPVVFLGHGLDNIPLLKGEGAAGGTQKQLISGDVLVFLAVAILSELKTCCRLPE
jgi:hypothetical protein